MSKTTEYAEALDRLDRLRDAGQITPGQYEAHIIRMAA